MRRRTFLLAGGGVVGTALAAPYAPLVVGRHFEALVADRLGLDEPVATALLERARERLGDARYDVRAAAFAVAVRDPYSTLVPGGSRRRAIETFVDELLDAPPERVAYVTGSAPGAACRGLLREP